MIIWVATFYPITKVRMLTTSNMVPMQYQKNWVTKALYGDLMHLPLVDRRQVVTRLPST